VESHRIDWYVGLFDGRSNFHRLPQNSLEALIFHMLLTIKHVAHGECSSVLGQAKADEINGISGIISSQESQNTRLLVTGQAFFEYSLLSLSNMACLLGNDYTAYSLLYFSHPPTRRFVRAELAWSVGATGKIGMLWAPTNMCVGKSGIRLAVR
jgi:hypothetical protein